MLVDTYGIPLELVVDRLVREGYMPDWIHFYETALERGWRPQGTYEKLVYVVGDVLGPDFRVEWERRMQAYLEDRHAREAPGRKG